MRQLAAIAALWGCVAMAQGASGVAILSNGEDVFRNIDSPPVFFFASPSTFGRFPAYSGLPAADGCYASGVTGSRGEALTFTRATARFCSTDGTSDEATGVMCASGEACIKTLNSSRGLDIFRAGTNLALRSEEISNAAWVKQGITSAAPTVTADAAVAPDGTMTADRVQVASCAAAGAVSNVNQDTGAAVNFHSQSVWLRGNASTPTVSFCTYSAGTKSCVARTLTTNWKRYSRENVTTNTGGNYFIVGCVNDSANYSGASDTGAADFFMWGAQVEAGSYITPYIKTVAATATRNTEIATFGAPGMLKEISPLSISGTRIGAATSASQPNTVIVAVPAISLTEGTTLSLLYGLVNGLTCYNVGAVDQRVAFATAAPEHAWCAFNRRASATADRASGAWPSGAAMSSTANVTGSGAAPVGIVVGSFNGGTSFSADGLISDVCVDPRPSKCR